MSLTKEERRKIGRLYWKYQGGGQYLIKREGLVEDKKPTEKTKTKKRA